MGAREGRGEVREHNSHIYENFNKLSEEQNGEVIHAIVHQESLEEDQNFLTPRHESDSSPLECNNTLLSSNSDRTM